MIPNRSETCLHSAIVAHPSGPRIANYQIKRIHQCRLSFPRSNILPYLTNIFIHSIQNPYVKCLTSRAGNLCPFRVKRAGETGVIKRDAACFTPSLQGQAAAEKGFQPNHGLTMKLADTGFCDFQNYSDFFHREFFEVI